MIEKNRLSGRIAISPKANNTKTIAIITKSAGIVNIEFSIPPIEILDKTRISILGIQPTFDKLYEVRIKTNLEGGYIEKFLHSFGYSVVEITRESEDILVALIES